MRWSMISSFGFCWVCEASSSVPFAYVQAWHISTAFIFGYYFFVVSVFNLNLPHVRAGLLICVLLLSNYFLFSTIWLQSHPTCTTTMIDVGQGDAILIEFPNKKRLLIDAGPLSQKVDAGERTVVPFLKRKGISTLDYFSLRIPIVITLAEQDRFSNYCTSIRY